MLHYLAPKPDMPSRPVRLSMRVRVIPLSQCGAQENLLAQSMTHMLPVSSIPLSWQDG